MKQKYKMLMHCLGAGEIKVYNTINKKIRADEVDILANATDDLNMYYKSTVCVGLDRYKFFHRGQGKDESIDDYVSALKNLAINCRFGGLHDEFIRDQIVMQGSNSSIQDTLWAKGEYPLQNIIDIARKAELTGRCAKAVLSENKAKKEGETVSKKGENRS